MAAEALLTNSANPTVVQLCTLNHQQASSRPMPGGMSPKRWASEEDRTCRSAESRPASCTASTCNLVRAMQGGVHHRPQQTDGASHINIKGGVLRRLLHTLAA